MPSTRALTALLSALVFAAPASAQGPSKRSAETIVREYERVSLPSFSDGSDPESVAKFKAEIAAGSHKKSALAWELYELDPDHAALPDMLWTRWCTTTNVDEEPVKTIEDASAFLEREMRPALRREAIFAIAFAALEIDGLERRLKANWAQRAAKAAPRDERAAYCLLELAQLHTGDPAEVRRLAEQVKSMFAESSDAANEANSVLRRLERVGQPLALAGDVVGGAGRVDVAEWRGKRVLVVLWSGFSDSSNRERAALLRLVAERPDVPVVGVYVWKHEGGREGLAKELAEQGVTWPNLYPEETFETPWSGPWAVSRVPLYYVLDEEGVVVALSHRVAPLTEVLSPSR